MRDGSKYYQDGRFKDVPTQQDNFENPYDIASAELNDVIRRKIAPFVVVTQNLATAGKLELNIPGQAFVVYGWETNSPLVRTVDTTAYVQLFLESDPGGQIDTVAGTATPNIPGFPMKHARGFRGPFSKAFIYWNAQSGVSIDIVIHRYRGLPWIDGESAT